MSYYIVFDSNSFHYSGVRDSGLYFAATNLSWFKAIRTCCVSVDCWNILAKQSIICSGVSINNVLGHSTKPCCLPGFGLSNNLAVIDIVCK